MLRNVSVRFQGSIELSIIAIFRIPFHAVLLCESMRVLGCNSTLIIFTWGMGWVGISGHDDPPPQTLLEEILNKSLEMTEGRVGTFFPRLTVNQIKLPLPFYQYH